MSFIAHQFVSVREKLVFGQVNEYSLESVRRTATVNCNDKTFKLTDASVMDNQGQLTHVVKVSDWRSVPVGSTASLLIDRMCKKLDE